jgi:hypothetical protein
MGKTYFSEQEITEVVQIMKEWNVPQENINIVVARLGKPPKKEISQTGIKVALKRKANQLKVNYDINLSQKDIRISNFTGTAEDFAQLKAIANNAGYKITE